MGRTLWLVPPPQERARLKQLMDNAPIPNLPSFEPHITIADLGSATVEQALAVLPDTKDLKRLQVDFKSIESQNVYFRSAIVNVGKTPGLNQLYDIVKKNVKSKLNQGVDSKSYPHMSLYYIDKESDRQLVMDNLLKTGKVVQKKDSLEIHVSGVVIKGFTAEEIVIARCGERINEWVIEKRIRLG